MPKKSSAKKRVRQIERRNTQNKAVRSAAKTQTKKVLAAIDSGEVDAVEKELPLAYKHLDKAAKKGILHPNAAARRKSKLAKKLDALKAGAKTT